MDDFISFWLQDMDDNVKNVENLNNMLNKLGIQFELNQTSNKEESYSFLNIKINNDTYKKVVKRNAGRPRKYNFDVKYTYGEVRQWQKDRVPVEEIVSKLKTTRATFYRRIKEANELKINDSEEWM